MRLSVLGAVLVLGTTLVPGMATAQERTPDPGSLRWVTLVTGDRVGVTPGKLSSAVVRPGEGRERKRFTTRQVGGRLHVVPEDAEPLLRKGVLDRRLFDVTALIESGYDDITRADLPLIMSAPQVRAAGVRVTAELPSVRAAAVTVAKSRVAQLWQTITTSGVERVWLDGKRKSTLDRSTAQIGAPSAWQSGLTGNGIKVAVLDTGVDETHPDLADRQLAEHNFTGDADAVDRQGHGTHVASTIAGTGAKSGGKFKGVAYGAKILDAKVLDSNGSGYDSWILAGMQWAAEQGATIANLSLGGGDGAEVDPLEEAVNTLTAKYGTLFVIAAGNSGPHAKSVGSPGSADAALTVGAVDRDDKLAPFSSRGPRVGDGAIKPDITAPGVGIVAGRATHGRIGTPAGDGYVSMSGTSMATPHVTGVAALLAQRHPGWKAADLKAQLTSSATPNPTLGVFEQGSGRVDVGKALNQTLISTSGSLGFGTQQWPHDDDKPVTKPVTYRNTGTTARTLTLRVETQAPQGMFTVDRTTVTVPAGGETTVQVTSDTRTPGADALYTGRLIASDSTVTVGTPLAVDKEAESYDVALDVTDRTGRPASDFAGTAAGATTDHQTSGANGKSTLRLPKGSYTLYSSIFTGSETTFLLHPVLEVTRNLAITLDARVARPVTVTVPSPTATVFNADVGFVRTLPDGVWVGGGILAGDLNGISTAHIGPSLNRDELTARVHTQWADSTRTYNLAWFEQGRLPTGFERRVREADLATVQAEYASVAGSRTGGKALLPKPLRGDTVAYSRMLDLPLPSRRTEHVLAEGVRWSGVLTQFGTGPDRASETELRSMLTRYRAGQSTVERWNTGVVGPAMPERFAPDHWLTRTGDTLTVRLPLFSDGAGHWGLPVRQDSGRTTVYQNGKKIAEGNLPGLGDFTLPKEAAEYRVEVEASRAATTLSTKVSASWTFRSRNTTRTTAVPAMAVRFTPKLDEFNRAQAGVPFTVPVTVERQPGSPGAIVRELTVEVSYDDGKTWQQAPVDKGAAKLTHPAEGGFVSLRAKVIDSDGNKLEQTIMRGYELKK
ncbi:S8 family serine peptidase [Crossiella cryophila]|uniref:S8 family peptidase n=1 Tax=Crossiella cryophila TaxID=43355 RepID=UPI0031EDB263